MMSDLCVSELLSGISSMPQQSKAAIGAVVGAIVADAASLPLQWIYKDADMDSIGHWKLSGDVIAGDCSPAFYPSSKCPFFTVSTGANSCYGDEMKTCLAGLADQDGELDLDHIQKGIQEKFGAPDSPYQIALAKRADKKYPVPGPWINIGVINSLTNMASGEIPPGDKSCDDNDGMTVCLPSYLLSYKDEDAEKTANLITTSPLAIGHVKIQTRIINNYIKRIPSPVDEAKEAFKGDFPEIIQEITKVEEALASGKSVLEVVSTFGKACGLPGSFQGSLAFILNPEPFSQNFSYAVESNIIAGGDCCSRANFIGACFGAKFGLEGIPVDWIKKVDGIEEIIKNAIKVYAQS